MFFFKPTAAGSNKGNQCREDKYSNQRMKHFRNMLQNPGVLDLRNDVKRAACRNLWQIQTAPMYYAVHVIAVRMIRELRNDRLASDRQQ
jgi:hypothetical protein